MRNQTRPWLALQTEPIITRHAAARMLERGVSLRAVRETIRDPFLVQRSTAGGIARILASALRGTHRAWLVVVMDAVTRHVVTVYWHSRRVAAGRRGSASRTAHPEQVNHGAA